MDAIYTALQLIVKFVRCTCYLSYCMHEEQRKFWTVKFQKFLDV